MDQLATEQLKSPTWEEFNQLPSESVAALAVPKVIVYAPGGTSRWYFLEHSQGQIGYSKEEQFEHYTRLGMGRMIEHVGMMCADGAQTVFLVGFVPGQESRTEDYVRNAARFFHLLTDAKTRSFYDQQGVGVRFRGVWDEVARKLGREDVLHEMNRLEEETSDRKKWLVWLTGDNRDVLPPSVLPFVMEHYQQYGTLADRAALTEAYYGRPLSKVDLFLGHNKPSVDSMTPPLLSLSDVYFSVTPSLYMDREGWRSILYDYLYLRRGQFRNYQAITPEALGELKLFYEHHWGLVMGVGERHEATQTWRPRMTAKTPD
jgi:hypothetical protein